MAHIPCFLLPMTPKSLNMVKFAMKLGVIQCQVRRISTADDYFLNCAFLGFKVWLYSIIERWGIENACSIANFSKRSGAQKVYFTLAVQITKPK